MTPEQAQALHRRFRRFHRKDDGAALLLRHRGFARQVAKKYTCSYLSLPEAMACAERGLYEALKRYDVEQGAFTTFAFFWMQKFLLAEKAMLKNVVRLPVSVVRKSRKVQAMQKRGVAADAIARELGVDEQEVERLAELHHAPTGVKGGLGGTLQLVDTTDQSVQEKVEYEEKRAALRAAIRCLDARARTVVLGRHADPPKSFVALARQCQVSRRVVELTFDRAMRTLQRRLRS
jgi:RNA polymerase sigma factor (sigma-70 family)